MVQKIDVLCYPSFTPIVIQGAGFVEKPSQVHCERHFGLHEVRCLMNYCGECGKPVSKKIPAGDNLPRFVCDSCQAIHYHNPKIVAGCIAEWEGQILLCRRAIEPKSGLWTFPAGFMEMGEGTEEAARRETLEEAHARVFITRLHSVLSLPHIGQVYMTFIGRLLAKEFEAGTESLDVRLFDRTDIPLNEIAFPVVKDALCRYLEDVTRGEFRLHVGNLPDRLI
jgi:ADP-ribose pyrophosphatase YjhB (NUDIX family)